VYLTLLTGAIRFTVGDGFVQITYMKLLIFVCFYFGNGHIDLRYSKNKIRPYVSCYFSKTEKWLSILGIDTDKGHFNRFCYWCHDGRLRQACL